MAGNRLKLSDLKENISIAALVNKKILSRDEFMVYYNVSYDWVMNKIKYYGLPNIAKFHFVKSQVDTWFETVDL